MEMSVNELSAPGYFTEAIVTRFREEVQHALKTGHLVDLLKKTDMLDMFPKENAKEWEESQRALQDAAKDPNAGTGQGQSWDVNQYGYMGGDNQNKLGGIGAGKRQIIGPRPFGPR